MTVDQCRLAAISSAFTDDEVEQVFLDTVIESEDDIELVIATLQKHRPRLLEYLSRELSLSK